MRALVTGGAGLVGSSIIDELLMEGVEVVSLDNYSAGKVENLRKARDFDSFTEVTGDIRDNDCLERIFADGYDWIFHEAVSKNTICMIDPHSDLTINAGGTLKLLQHAKRVNVQKFIHASTGSVYGHVSKYPTLETDPLCPVSFYGNSKLAAENYVRLFNEMFGLPTVILRYFHVYGSRQDNGDFGGVIPLFIRKALQNETIHVTGDGRQLRAFTHVSDIAKINMKVLKSTKSGEIYNCASDSRVEIKELAEKILQLIPSSRSQIKHVPDRLGDIYKFDISNEKLKTEIGFSNFTSFEDGLLKTLREMEISYI